MCADAVGHAQAGAQVVRVGDAVEYQQQWRAVDGVQQLIEIARQRQLRRKGDHALVTARADDFVETRRIDGHDAHVGRLGGGDHVFHAAVDAAGIDENFFHGRRFMTQTRGDGVEAENHFILHLLSFLLSLVLA